MTHIGKESRLQPVGFFGFLFCLYQFGFRFFQGSDIVVDSNQFHLAFFRLIEIQHYIGTHPVPFILRTGTQNTHLTFEGFCFPFLCFFKKSKHTGTVIRMHFGVNTDYIGKRCILIFSHILEPLLDGIALTIQQIEFGISHLGIIRYKKKQILKIRNTLQGINTLRIIHINKDISGKVTMIII